VNGGASTARVPLRTRENATFVMLASNSDIDDAVRSVHELEIRFNHKYKYPWVFLNDQPFSDDFKKCVLTPFLFSLIMSPDVAGARTHTSRVSIIASGPVHFGQIPEEHWHQPSWIDEAKATEGREKLVKNGIGRGDSVPCGVLHLLPCPNSPDEGPSRYRNMCRFFSGVRSALSFT
jgi:alpha 1,2-mannosyltransferase